MHHLNGFVGTICSNGTISLWGTAIPNVQLTLICTVTDDSVRPTCIRLIDTTENRYKKVDSVDEPEHEPVKRKHSKPISTTAKVIVEANDDDDDEDNIWKLEVTEGDDTDTEVLLSPEKKKPKKNKVVPPKPTSTPAEAIALNRPKRTLKKKVPPKPIVLRALNSDDDFDDSISKLKGKKLSKTVETSQAKSQKKPNTNKVEQSQNVPAVNGTRKKSNSLSESKSIPKKQTKKKTTKTDTAGETPQKQIADVKQPTSNSTKQSQDVPTVAKRNKLNSSLSGGTSTPKTQKEKKIPATCPPAVHESGTAGKSRKTKRKIDLNRTE